jgi:hypothetical protein
MSPIKALSAGMDIPCSWSTSLFTWCYMTYAVDTLFLILSSFCLTHCTCGGVLLHLIILQDTHTHTNSVGLLLVRDRPVAVTFTAVDTTSLNKAGLNQWKAMANFWILSWNILYEEFRYHEATNLIFKGKSYSACCLHCNKCKPTHLIAFPTRSHNNIDSFITSH